MSVSPFSQSGVQFGKVVKVVGGDAAERRSVAQQYADAQNEKLGSGKAEHLRAYEETEAGDQFEYDYVAFESPDDSAEEAKQTAELRFRYDRAKSGYGAAYRSGAAKSFTEYMRDYFFLFARWADGAEEKTVESLKAELQTEL